LTSSMKKVNQIAKKTSCPEKAACRAPGNGS
jgi:hypothetical protein